MKIGEIAADPYPGRDDSLLREGRPDRRTRPAGKTVIAPTARATSSACHSSAIAVRWTCHWPKLVASGLYRQAPAQLQGHRCACRGAAEAGESAIKIHARTGKAVEVLRARCDSLHSSEECGILHELLRRHMAKPAPAIRPGGSHEVSIVRTNLDERRHRPARQPDNLAELLRLEQAKVPKLELISARGGVTTRRRANSANVVHRASALSLLPGPLGPCTPPVDAPTRSAGAHTRTTWIRFSRAVGLIRNAVYVCDAW